MIAPSPYIIHAPEPGPDGRCALCRRETSMATGRLEHKRDPRLGNERHRFACKTPTGPVGEPCEGCGRPLREYVPGKVEHARGRVAGVSPHALPGTPGHDAMVRRRMKAQARRLLSPRPGYCECGTPLATHPPLPRPGPLTSEGWPGRGEGIKERTL